MTDLDVVSGPAPGPVHEPVSALASALEAHGLPPVDAALARDPLFEPTLPTPEAAADMAGALDKLGLRIDALPAPEGGIAVIGADEAERAAIRAALDHFTAAEGWRIGSLHVEDAAGFPTLHVSAATLSTLIERWFVDAIHNSAVSQAGAEAVNHVRKATDELKRRLGCAEG